MTANSEIGKLVAISQKFKYTIWYVCEGRSVEASLSSTLSSSAAMTGAAKVAAVSALTLSSKAFETNRDFWMASALLNQSPPHFNGALKRDDLLRLLSSFREEQRCELQRPDGRRDSQTAGATVPSRRRQGKTFVDGVFCLKTTMGLILADQPW